MTRRPDAWLSDDEHALEALRPLYEDDDMPPGASADPMIFPPMRRVKIAAITFATLVLVAIIGGALWLL